MLVCVVQAYLSRACYYGLKGVYTKAILNCNEAIKLQPNSVRAYLYRSVNTEDKDIRAYLYRSVNTEDKDVRAYLYRSVNTEDKDIRAYLYRSVSGPTCTGQCQGLPVQVSEH